MKARVLIMAAMVAFTSFANAQEKKQEEKQLVPQFDKKIEAHVERMNERFLLDDAKAEKFAVLYKAYLEEKFACRPQYVFGEKLTDDQMEANLEMMLDIKEKSLEIDKKYYKKLSKLLNVKQLYIIFGNQIQRGGHPMPHGKGMPPRKFDRPVAPDGKCPKDFKKRDCKKAPDCKKAVDCKKNVCCPKCKACPKALECKMKADCKKECRQETKCIKDEAAPKNVENVVATENVNPAQIVAATENVNPIEGENVAEVTATESENVVEVEQEL